MAKQSFWVEEEDGLRMDGEGWSIKSRHSKVRSGRFLEEEQQIVWYDGLYPGEMTSASRTQEIPPCDLHRSLVSPSSLG